MILNGSFKFKFFHIEPTSGWIKFKNLFNGNLKSKNALPHQYPYIQFQRHRTAREEWERKGKLKIHFVINFLFHFNSKHIKDQLKQIFILLRTFFSRMRVHYTCETSFFKKKERKEKLIFLFSLKNIREGWWETEICFIFLFSCILLNLLTIASIELTPVQNLCEWILQCRKIASVLIAASILHNIRNTWM